MKFKRDPDQNKPSPHRYLILSITFLVFAAFTVFRYIHLHVMSPYEDWVEDLSSIRNRIIVNNILLCLSLVLSLVFFIIHLRQRPEDKKKFR